MPGSREIDRRGLGPLERSGTGVVMPDAEQRLPTGELVHVYVTDTIVRARQEKSATGRGRQRDGREDDRGERRGRRGGRIMKFGRAGIGAALGVTLIYGPVHFIFNDSEPLSETIPRDMTPENAFDVMDGAASIIRFIPGVG